MTNPAKLNLSTPTQGKPARDLWRTVSDFSGGALSILVWLALWAWIALAVVGPLSSVIHAPRAAATLLT